MPLPPLIGHDRLRTRLATAMSAGRLPPAILLVGPPGVGKQRLGLWIGQGLLCERGPGEPCEACQSCRLAAALGHPDLHWFFPIPRPKAEDAKVVEEAEELHATALAARREQPLYSRPDGMAGLFLPLVRALHRRAQLRPAMGRAKVFVIGEAERLVPQASSPEAANAMLKVLEEPPPDTVFILTAAQADGLLPTIRSRLVHMRVGRLPAGDVVRFLTTVPVPPVAEAEARRRADLATGSIGEALALAGQTADLREAAQALLEAAKDAVARHRYALAVKPFGGRGDFSDVLATASELLRDDLARQLQRGTGEAPATRLLAQIRALDEARRLARGNVNPQLIVSNLLRQLAAPA